MDNLGSLNVFVQAAETRSFTVAARQLGISSSAVGKAVARLEERLGVRLFHRSTRSVTLTPEGALFLDRCRRIFCEVEAAELEISQSRDAPRGRLRISMPLIGTLMMPVVMAFMRAFPDIELDLDLTDELVDVIEGGFDAVVRTGDVSDSRLMTRMLGTFSHRVVGSPDYFARMGTPSCPQDLKDHKCLRHKYPSTGKLERWPFWDGARDVEVDLPTIMVASTLEPLICTAEQGFGISCLPSFAVRSQLADGRLVSVLENHTRDVGAFRILWPASRHPSPKVSVFVRFMADNLFLDPPPPAAS